MTPARKKLVARPTAKKKALSLSASGKGKPPAKKPGAASAGRSVVKPVIHSSSRGPVKPVAKAASKPPAKGAPKPVAKAAVKPAAKPAAKTPPPMNKGAAMAKAVAAARAAAAAEAAAAAKAAAEAKRAPRLVPATANAIRPGAAKSPTAKGKASNKPPAEVRPLGVLPPESMVKSKPAPQHAHAPMPVRPSAHVRPAASAPHSAPPAESLTAADLKHFEQRLLTERARIMREMGHLENTILKANARGAAGELSGGYSFNMADAGTDSMEREISFDLASKEGRLVREIDDALRRIYNGVYGVCEASGATIARARLETLPWARYTVQEQENMERLQRAGRLQKEEE
jgi:RNA polymerase-binding transcription factor DksA